MTLLARLVVAALVCTAVLRGALFLSSEPLLALANNHDMIRVQGCIDAYPIRDRDRPDLLFLAGSVVPTAIALDRNTFWTALAVCALADIARGLGLRYRERAWRGIDAARAAGRAAPR